MPTHRNSDYSVNVNPEEVVELFGNPGYPSNS